jgi:PTS system ascorbate-specific IIA component
MAALLIVAHSPLASALKAVAEHVYPDCGAGLAAADVAPGATVDEVEATVRGALQRLGAGEALIMVDAFGATPCNAALRVADGVAVRVVSGVNVPMLWRCLCYAADPLDQLVSRAVEGATMGVLQVSPPRPQRQSSYAPAHDQVDDHDQQ